MEKPTAATAPQSPRTRAFAVGLRSECILDASLSKCGDSAFKRLWAPDRHGHTRPGGRIARTAAPAERQARPAIVGMWPGHCPPLPRHWGAFRPPSRVAGRIWQIAIAPRTGPQF